MRNKPTNQHGFTIIELMISLSVLSIILLSCTIILMNIGALYTKGVNASNLQNTSRSIMADVSAAIQFSGSAPVLASTSPVHKSNFPTGEAVNAICIGTSRYTYLLDYELGTDSYRAGGPTTTPHVLWKDTIVAGSPCTVVDITQATPVLCADNTSTPCSGGAASGYEMAGDHMSLTNFNVTQSGSSDAYTVNVWMAFGDYDLVQPGNASTQPTCLNGSGTQFCSTTSLTSLVAGRIY